MVGWLQRHARALALAVSFALVATLAAIHPGVPAAQVSLHDGGVWVTHRGLRLAAHLNYPSRTLDGGVRAASGSFDVSQAANAVLLADRGGSELRTVDTAVLTLEGNAGLPEGVDVFQGGTTALLVDTQAGRVWLTDVDGVRGFSVDQTPTLEEVPGVRGVVNPDGEAFVVLPDGAVRAITSRGTKDIGRIKDLGDLSVAEVSVVGREVVVLDRDTAHVRTTAGATPLADSADARLQQPARAGDAALVATRDALVSAPLAGGEPTAVPSGGEGGLPAAPVWLEGCAYSAWGQSGRYVRDCPGEADDQVEEVSHLRASTNLVFRVNRGVIVLNDVATGLVLLANDGMRQVDNWDQIQNQIDEQSDTNDDTNELEDTLEPQERTEQQTPPVAQDDTFGVRPGRVTSLPVLFNDSDPDGDVLIARPTSEPGFGTVGVVRGGGGLNIDVPADAKGATTFTYVADDGRGGSAEATVTIEVHPTDANEAPRQERASTMTLAAGGQASYLVLPDWIDPDGDATFLASAAPASGLAVTHRPDGLVTVRDLGTAGGGVRAVPIVVTDGTEETEETLRVTVLPTGNLPPVANADHLRVVRGQEVVARPLANDVDPNGDELRLASVQKPTPAQRITPDFAAGEFTFSSSEVGTVYLEYLVTDGPSQATGYVRVDVVEPAEDAVPAADNDLALLHVDGSALVDVLANDSDPAGRVLVIQSVTPPSGVGAQGLAVEVIDHGLLRVSAPGGLEKQVDFAYTISNGRASATGRVTVVPMPPSAVTEPPVALPDAAVVRAGDIVTVPVLANDRSPAGLPLELDPELSVQGPDGAGDAFTSRSVLRFRAGDVRGRVRITYTVRDSKQNYGSAEAVIEVIGPETPNTPPKPEPLVARVLAGSSVRIQVPLDGVDPEGDYVSLAGLDTAPRNGVVQVGPGYLEYAAPSGDDAVGTDTFAYAVVDRFGSRSTATVQVGVAPPSPTNQSPVAVPDSISVRPGRTVSVAVTANDIDPDGDPVTLVPDSVVPVDSGTTAEATVRGDRVEVTAPDEPGKLQYYYEIGDGRGGSAKGVLTVDVRSDAALHHPVALDDILMVADTAGKEVVDVDVLANDSDADGSLDELTITADEGGASVVDGKVRVPVLPDRQVLLYSITDADGQVGRAAIIVPGAASEPPFLNPERVPVKAKGGDLVTIALADYVVVREGRTPLLTFETKIAPGPGHDGSPIVQDARTLTFRTKTDFVGPSSLAFEVTDGATPDDPDGLTAVLSIPFEIESSGLTQPTFRPSDVTVAAGEPAKEADLRLMVTDPDSGDLDKLRFSLGEVTPGFEARLDGSTLRVSAPVEAKPGAQGSARITVTDGSTEPVAGDLRLTVVASTRPKMSVTTAVIDNAKAGSPSTVDLSQYVTNPFADEGKPIQLVGAPTVAAGQGSVTASGTTLTITPAQGFHGQMTVGYTMQDATLDASRNVAGQVQLTVRDRPDAPTSVSAETHESRTATVSWTAGANNGAQITAFTVRWSGGEQNCGQATNCVITSLTNNVTYTFTVVATNEVGDSDPSAASNAVRPDVKPSPPGVPAGTFGDKQISLTWAAAQTEGSPVRSYTVEISPAAGGVTQATGVTGTSYTWTGLTNGTAYSFRVQAHSDAEEPSDFSGSSSPVVPAGVPLNPVAPTVKKDPVSTLPPSATISWSPPDGNGDAAMTYEVRRTGGAVVYTGTGTSTQVTLDVATENQTFEMRASNKAGWGAWSSVSNAVRGFSAPGTVTNLQATATGNNNEVKLTFGAAPGNGALASEITYHWSAGGASGQLAAGGGTITNGAFVNGQNVSVSVHARSTVGGESINGTPVSATVNAYGPPKAPSMSCSGGDQSVTCNWSGGDGNGRNTTFVLSDAAGDIVGASGNRTFGGIGYSATRRLCVTANQEGGRSAGPNCNQATSNPPPPSATVSKGGSAVGKTGCSSASCAHFKVTTANFPAGSHQYQCRASNVNPSNDTSAFSNVRSANFPANGSVELACYFGYPGESVWVEIFGVLTTGQVKW